MSTRVDDEKGVGLARGSMEPGEPSAWGGSSSAQESNREVRKEMRGTRHLLCRGQGI